MKLRSESLSQDELVKVSELCSLDWELKKADTTYYTHGYHTYSASTPREPRNI
jgi:hypothetical protein